MEEWLKELQEKTLNKINLAKTPREISGGTLGSISEVTSGGISKETPRGIFGGTVERNSL